MVGYYERQFGLTQADRRYHLYSIGRTGTGKSTLFLKMIAQDLAAGRGLALIDPHGDLAESALSYVPKRRLQDVIYFHPADAEHPVGLNVFEPEKNAPHYLVAANIVSIFRKSWKEFWGPRMGYLLENAILALLEYPNATLLGLQRLLTDVQYRNKVIAGVTDPVVKHYWQVQFVGFPERLLPEITSPVLNKVGSFLANDAVRNIVGQKRSAINFRDLMDKKRILIANLSKGKIGESGANLLGSLLIAKLQFAAMARADTPEDRRQDFNLFVDEFQNFVTESFADILAEARKYRLCLHLANQYLGQVDEGIRDAVLANAGTLVSFRLGPDDARVIAREFEPQFDYVQVMNLDAHEIICKVMEKGKVSQPIQGATLLPSRSPSEKRKRAAIKLSRTRYAKKRTLVASAVNEFFESGNQAQKKSEILLQ